jgi:signal recognition particle receptor subunit beta
MIIGLTHTDYEDAWEANDIALALGMSQVSQRPPIVNVNADRADSVAKCLLVLVERLIQMSIAGSGRG